MRNKPKKRKPVMDIVILTGGRFDMLEKCLVAIKEVSALDKVPVHTIVIDNGTPRPLREKYEHLFDGVTSKRLYNPVGFAEGCNKGASLGKSSLILFLNDDVVVLPGFFKSMVKRIKSPKVGIVGAKLLFPLDSMDANRPAGAIQHVGITTRITGAVYHLFVGWSADNPRAQIEGDVWAVTGAALLVHRGLFHKAGGFDPMYGLGTWEDVDLCMASHAMGYKVQLEPKAVAYHYTGATSTSLNRPFPVQRNMQMFYDKWKDKGVVEWNEWRYL